MSICLCIPLGSSCSGSTWEVNFGVNFVSFSVSTPMKNISPWKGLSHIFWKNKKMFQTTIQIYTNIYYIFFSSAISQVQRGRRRKKVAQPNRATARWQIPEVKVKVYNSYTIGIHMCDIRYIFYLDTAFTHFANDHRKHHLCSSAFLATFIAHWPTGWTSCIPRTLCRVLWVHRAAALATSSVSWSSTTFP